MSFVVKLRASSVGETLPAYGKANRTRKLSRDKTGTRPGGDKILFSTEKAHVISISAVCNTILQKGKWCPNGAHVNKQDYEEYHEIMKQKELFDNFMRSYQNEKSQLYVCSPWVEKAQNDKSGVEQT